VEEYLNYVGTSKLSKTKYKVVTFAENTSIRTKANVMENRKIANQASHATSEPAPGAGSSSREG
jgi:hypothetical protein